MFGNPRRAWAWAATRWPEILLVVFCAANVGAIVLEPAGEAVPFHFIWVGLTFVYGLRAWRLRSTVVTLGVAMLVTAAALGWAVVDAGAGLDEIAEVPLMAAMFVVVMMHVERRQAALTVVRRLAASERRLLERERNLVRNTSHELRTPITIARGHAELIRKTATGQAAEDAEVILDELNRLSQISERLLILAAAEHPRFLRRAPLDLERFITEAVKRWSVTARRRWRVSVTLDGVLNADEERLQSTLDALLENAVKFTVEGDEILVSARSEGTTAIIEVSDTGTGMQPEHLGQIFDRFARAGEAPQGRNRGTGLGLAIVKAVVEAHGGRVTVDSRPGEGTTFSLLLPGFGSALPVRKALGTAAEGRAEISTADLG